MGIRWHYWMWPMLFLSGGAYSIYCGFTTTLFQEDKHLLIGGGLILKMLGILSLLFPLLRVRERFVVSFSTLTSNGQEYSGLFVGISKSKQIITILGGIVMGGGSILGSVIADSFEDRVQFALLTLAYICVGTLYLYHLRNKPLGILLAHSGIVWHQALSGPKIIKWNNIRKAVAYLKKDEYAHYPCFGLVVLNPQETTPSRHICAKLTADYRRWGYHLSYPAESVLWPVEQLEQLVQFYLDRPDLRAELSNRTALHRANRWLEYGPQVPKRYEGLGSLGGDAARGAGV
jgi:hypothetical protein